jgi:hypothetical protein
MEDAVDLDSQYLVDKKRVFSADLQETEEEYAG